LQSDIEDVVRMANDLPYGLAASVWTTSFNTAHRMSKFIERDLSVLMPDLSRPSPTLLSAVSKCPALAGRTAGRLLICLPG